MNIKHVEDIGTLASVWMLGQRVNAEFLELYGDNTSLVDYESAFYAEADDSTIRGLAIYYLADGFVMLHVAWVDPKWRGQGIYRQLFEKVKGIAAQQPKRKMMLGVAMANLRSREVHEDLGCRPVMIYYECK